MNKKKNNYLISASLILLAITFTILVKIIDVKPVGVNGADIGFSTINKFIFDKVGVNTLWYDITEYLGYITLFGVLIYGVVGLVQLIKRKSLLKVDKELIILGMFYVCVLFVYVLFEKVVINYRPILMEGVLEASYPSSHTLMTVCFCSSFILINKMLFKNKITKYVNIMSMLILIVMPVGRLLSGVHWFIDIIGGLLISSALIMCLYSVLCHVKK